MFQGPLAAPNQSPGIEFPSSSPAMEHRIFFPHMLVTSASHGIMSSQCVQCQEEVTRVEVFPNRWPSWICLKHWRTEYTWGLHGVCSPVPKGVSSGAKASAEGMCSHHMLPVRPSRILVCLHPANSMSFQPQPNACRDTT